MVTKATCSVLDLDPIQSLNMNGNRIEGLGSPVVTTDAANKDYVDLNALPVIGGTMSGSINMDSNSIFNLVDPINPQDAATKNYVDTAGSALESYLNDPTVTRTSPDTFTVGRFQASPLTAATPLVSTLSAISRQLTNLFLRPNAGLNGIAEAQGAFAVPAEASQSDISFSTGPNRITAASGSPFSALVAGDKVIVDGSTSNDGTYDVTASTATTIDTAQTLTVEVSGASVSIFRVEQGTTYHMFAVEETGVGTVDIAIDISFSGSNIGSFQSTGWTAIRRLWSFVLDNSSDIEGFLKFGNYCSWTSIQNDLVSGVAGQSNPTTRVPTGISVLGRYGVGAVATFVANQRIEVLLSSGLLSSAIPSANPNAAGGHVIGSSTFFAAHGFGTAEVITDTSGRIFSHMTFTTGSGTYNIWTEGYTDERKV